MLTLKHWLFLLIIPQLLTVNNSYGQRPKHSLAIYTGFGLGNPDTRNENLYFRYSTEPFRPIITGSVTTLDDEYSVGLIYKNGLSNRVRLGLGIGYAQLVQDFMLPAEGNAYFGQVIEPFFWRDISRYHMVQWQPSVDVDVLHKTFQTGINISGISNISFRKQIRSYNLSRNNLEYFSSEVYTGIYGTYKRIRLDIGYRILHWKYRDDAIANNRLNPDSYNPAKWRFLLSYQFWRSRNAAK